MDPNFTPGSDEYGQQLFQEQQDFLYSVLISSLKTDFSEALVKNHEGDAQLILELLQKHHTGNSQYSRSEINRITKYLTNIKLDDTGRGTNESFLMHYNDQLHLVDSLVDSDENLRDNTRVTFLESAVESVPDLRHVKITDNVLQAQLDSTRPISYRSYFDLLKDAAFHLDQAAKRGNKVRRTNVHFSGPHDEDEHETLSSDDPQVIQQEDVCSEPPEPLSYSVFQSHFHGSSTSNTHKIFLPKPIWEKLSKDQQQMIIDHNRSLPKSGSSHLSTPNKNPSPLPHKPTPQQTAKSQQVHTHKSDEGTAVTASIETTSSDPLLAMVHQSINTSDDDASDITKVLSAKRSRQIQVCKRYLFQHANHTNNQLIDRGANGGNRSLLSSGGLMADVPCLDHSLDGCKGRPDDVQTTKHARRTHAWSRYAQTSLGAHTSLFGASGARFWIVTCATSARIEEPSMVSILYIKSSIPDTYK